VDDRLETNVKDIFAAGDCTEHRGRINGLWAPSVAQGIAAGRIMAGGTVSYKGTFTATSLKVAAIQVVSRGDVWYLNDKPHQEFRRWDPGTGIYVKLFAENDIVTGLTLVGDIPEKDRIQKTIGARTAEIDPAWGLSRIL
jgi:nitrite reductase (NADH) large subunit